MQAFRNISLIFGKELRTYFSTIAGYIIVSSFLAMSGLAFFYFVYRFQQASMRPVFQIICFLLAITVPALTTRLLSGEFRSGNMQLLAASAVPPYQIALGKFFFSLFFVLVLLICTLHLPLLLLHYGTPDMGEVLCGYIGLLLAGTFFASVGLLASSLSRSAVIALIITLAILLGLFFLPTDEQTQTSALAAVSVFGHFANFARGVLDTSDLVFFLVATLFFVVLTVKVLGLRQRI